MSRGALIGPEGLTGEVINEQEYKYLKSCLAVIRDIPAGPMLDAIQWIDLIVSAGRHSEEAYYAKFDGLFLYLIEKTNGRTMDDDISGVLIDHGLKGDARLLLDEREAERLDAYLTVLRMGGWFRDWLVARIGTLAEERQYPTPLEMMRALGQEVEEFGVANAVVCELLGRFPHVYWTRDLNDRGTPKQPEPPPKPRKPSKGRKAA